MIVYNFLVSAVVTYCGAHSVPLDFIKPEPKNITQNNNFVEVIKHDLKRNNDDYKDGIQEKKIINDNGEYLITDKDKDSKLVTSQIKKSGYRRYMGDFYQDYYHENEKNSNTKAVFKSNKNKTSLAFVKETPNIINTQRNQSRLANRMKTTLPTIRNISFTSSVKHLRVTPHVDIPNFVKNNKINKFKHFMKKNEDLFKNFINNKQKTKTQLFDLRQNSVVNNNLKTLKPKPINDGMKKTQRTEDKNNGRLPSPELLDMAPAIGGRIHRQREKGRLCHRHVLMPEGPKYDSRGRWYVPAHELIVKRPYPNTRQPKLLLPRCCNCCKKSVLGCE